ncbi:N-acetylmuramic acid 6-phosphate etherase [Acutalibacter caecimuris]|uniref:N-acetylmuramic acid 6-phosphate etherase n=1 Tax=Acutalibacter caecimuris TaxID=3093657 RepID=UPI002AC977E8|nr:N-acetylmuramic acid 6-phosphate etherase [Acutalibacter sp. M00118]
MDYANMITEQANPDTADIDLCSTQEILELIHKEDCKVAMAVGKILPQIAKVVDAAADGMRKGGRLIYVGAGTSGRLGILDASECPPTFGTRPEQVVGIIAGGDIAMRNAIEGAEDNGQMGAADIERMNVCEHDTVVGITASGSARYVLGALEAAKARGAVTGAVCNTFPGVVASAADIAIIPVTGPEAIMGSTRMKAGTAQKMVLNMISTATMVRLGKVYHNLMVDLAPSNAKLRDRSIRIVMQATDVSRQEAEEALKKAQGYPKLAILQLLCGCDIQTARELLENESTLRKAVKNYEKSGCGTRSAV